MLFNSQSFLIFFPVVSIIYFIIPKKVKNLWLLVTSYYFYMCWQPVYALLILFSTFSTFVCSIAIDKASTKKLKKISLIFSITVNLAILFLFKYYGFFSENISSLLSVFGLNISMPKLDLLLPVGISFYTFQALGYAIDVYLGTVKREKNFLTYALFVSFFPQLVAGPIERSKNLLPQFYDHKKFEYSRVKSGLVLMAWGFFKKMVIADGLATFVTLVYSNPQNYSGIQMIITTIMFSFQVYCDFAGYSDIARGCARVLGFELMKNFDKPYFSQNLKTFWSRWHISLSTWFQDYIFMPFVWLNPLKKFGFTNPPVLAGTWLVFLISGLWHGASWTFVIWGALHGFYRTVEELLRKYYKKPDKHPKPLKYTAKVIWVFLLVSFSYIFFRANTLSDAFYISTHLFKDINLLFTPGYFISQLEGITFFAKNGIPLVLCVLFMLVMEAWEGKGDLIKKVTNLVFPLRWAFYYGVILLILFYGNFGKSPFVYFDF